MDFLSANDSNLMACILISCRNSKKILGDINSELSELKNFFTLTAGTCSGGGFFRFNAVSTCIVISTA